MRAARVALAALLIASVVLAASAELWILQFDMAREDAWNCEYSRFSSLVVVKNGSCIFNDFYTCEGNTMRQYGCADPSTIIQEFPANECVIPAPVEPLPVEKRAVAMSIDKPYINRCVTADTVEEAVYAVMGSTSDQVYKGNRMTKNTAQCDDTFAAYQILPKDCGTFSIANNYAELKTCNSTHNLIYHCADGCNDNCLLYQATELACTAPVQQECLIIPALPVPAEAPVATPIEAPVDAPVDSPVAAPVDAPVDAPVQAAVATPVAVETPVDSSVAPAAVFPPNSAAKVGLNVVLVVALSAVVAVFML